MWNSTKSVLRKIHLNFKTFGKKAENQLSKLWFEETSKKKKSNTKREGNSKDKIRNQYYRNKHMIKKVTKPKSGFFEKSNKWLTLSKTDQDRSYVIC